MKYELVNTMKDPHVEEFFRLLGKEDGEKIEIKTEKAFDKFVATLLENGCIYFLKLKDKNTYQIRVIRNKPIM